MTSKSSSQISGTEYRYSSVERLGEPKTYCLAVEKNEGGNWNKIFISVPFTEDASEAERYAKIFTESSLSPVHLYEVIDDLQGQ